MNLVDTFLLLLQSATSQRDPLGIAGDWCIFNLPYFRYR